MTPMPSLFDNDDPDATQGFKNLRAAPADSEGGKIQAGLEEFWQRFEPYADKDFVKEFGRHPEERFWEMYLGVRLLEGRQALRKRNQLPKKARDEGPDFCIQQGHRKIWVEVIAPSPGDEDNLDKVPDLFASGAAREARRKIELRIGSALKTKTDKFARYREKGIIGPDDSCVVAIAASQFALEAAAESGAGLPLPVTTVFPFGEEVITIDPQTAEFTSLSHKYSGEIERAQKEGKKPAVVPCTAFQNEYFSGIDGLIWSHRSTGNFLGNTNDLVYVHNQLAKRPLPKRWMDWQEEYSPIDGGTKLRRTKRKA
jgi:hypothetical protein